MRRRNPDPSKSPMAGAFIAGLRKRVQRDSNGKVVLPTGRANVGEIAKVLKALDTCRDKEQDKC
jgi:hypothetical protein